MVTFLLIILTNINVIYILIFYFIFPAPNTDILLLECIFCIYYLVWF